MTISVFIADDHSVVRDGLRSLMDDFPDFNVVGVAGNGVEAVRLVNELKPDVVVMDISMPLMNGIDAAKEILKSLPKTRVIILSMLGTPEHVYQSLRAGACGYILKESASREVIEAIQACAAGKTYLSQPVTLTLIDDYLNLRDEAMRKSPLDCLSAREREILEHVVQGKSSAAIGEMLNISRKTVESYRSRMMQKLGVEDLPALVRLAMHEGLVE